MAIKKLFSVITVVSLVISTSTIVAKSTSSEQPTNVVTKTDLNNMSGKKHSDKAWKQFDKFLSKVIGLSTATAALGYIIPTGDYDFLAPKYTGMEKLTVENGFNLGIVQGEFDHGKKLNIPYPSFDLTNVYVAYNETGSSELHDGNLILAKPHLVHGSITVAAIAALAKLGVKIKRARDHNKNLLNFIISDMWTK